MQYDSTFKYSISQISLPLMENMLLKNIPPRHPRVLSGAVSSNGLTKQIQDPRHGVNDTLCFEPVPLIDLSRYSCLWVVGSTPQSGPNHGILSSHSLPTWSMKNALWDGPATALPPDLTTLLLLLVSHPTHLPNHFFR